jgi:hypothetical protein
MFRQYATIALVCLVVIAIVWRVPAVRSVVTGA